MRNLFSNLLIILFLFVNFRPLSAQELQKENIAVLRFSGWKGTEAQIYQNSLTEKISTLIIQSQRFNVIDRLNIDKVLEEQKFGMTGIVDENTIVKVGKIIGVEKLIIGSFTKNSTDDHKGKYKVYDKDRGKYVTVAKRYYQANVSVSIQMVDVETGQYIEAAEANGMGKGTNTTSALTRALDNVATNVVEAFFKYFAIHGFIESIDESYTILDQGASIGIKRFMNFEILDITKTNLLEIGKFTISPNTKRIGLLKIVKAERNSAEARFIGDFSAVRAGHLIREVKENVTIEATIIEKNGGEVVIDMGSDVGLRNGATFNVLGTGNQYVDPVTGESFGIEEFKKGTVYISKVGSRFSKGKIIKGRYKVKKNAVLRETEPWKSNYMLTVSFGMYNIKADVNTSPWAGQIDNEYVESKNESVDYSDREKIDSGTMLKIQLGKWNVVKGLSYMFGIGIFQITDEVGGSTFDFAVTKHIGIIPDLFDFYIGAGIGTGTAQQKIKPEVIKHLSNDYGDKVFSNQFQFNGKFGVRFAIGGNMSLFGEADYMGMTFKKWKYTIEHLDENNEDRLDVIKINNDLVPYPELSISGPNFRVGLVYNIIGLKRLFWIF